MPTFDTPEPISVTIDLARSTGEVRIVASERPDTVVEVYPSDESNEADVKAAKQARVEYADGRLLIKAMRQFNLLGWGGSIDVTVGLPAGSRVHGDAAMGGFRCEGRLGDCSFKTSYGDIRLNHSGALHLTTGRGEITVDHAVGHAEVTTRHGIVRIGQIDGTAVVKNSNGDSMIGEITGNLRMNGANGDMYVDRAHASVEARTATGSIRVAEVMRGAVVLETADGELEVGIHEGTVAWLDVRSVSGSVHNSLNTCDGPEQSDETVEVRARAYLGDVVIRRS